MRNDGGSVYERTIGGRYRVGLDYMVWISNRCAGLRMKVILNKGKTTPLMVDLTTIYPLSRTLFIYNVGLSKIKTFV